MGTTARETTLRPRYKLTETGVIPQEWDIQSCADICIKIQDGTHFSPKLGGNDYQYITSKNIRSGFLDISNADWIDAAQHKAIYQRCDVKYGDLLITKDGANTGNAALNNIEREFSLLSSVAFLRFDPKRYAAGYFLQQILSTFGRQQIQAAMSGNAITRLTLEKIKKLQFPVPTFPEQTAIATALSDVDALLISLDKLITKKRNIKQATMQLLLTGTMRLPGFRGKWERRKFAEIFQFLNTANSPRSDLSTQGEIGYIHYGDIHTRQRAFLDGSQDELPFIPNEKVGNVPFLENGDLVMADASEDYDGLGVSMEVKYVAGRKMVAGLHTLLLRGDKSVLMDGFKGYLQYIPAVKEALKKAATGISVYGISKQTVKNIAISLPDVPEQQAIIAILSAMDAEIVALERRRAKVRALKQGMMQELLTGRIRLR